jgi:MEMO1 family protein
VSDRTRGPEGPADYARLCVECVVCGRLVPGAPEESPYARQAACFVSLKKDGRLRGCIGTLEPAEPHLGAEIARNARSAAFDDPRFAAVREDELASLAYSVDVLSASEPCALEELDPRVYGVIVAAGHRRGVLLPDLEGIDSVAEQVGVALQKAGIRPDERFSIRRFKVTRYREGERSGDLPEETGEIDG